VTDRLHEDDIEAIAERVAAKLRAVSAKEPRRAPAEASVPREKIAAAKERALRKLAKIRKAAPHG
jgi:hypothetical protein